MGKWPIFLRAGGKIVANLLTFRPIGTLYMEGSQLTKNQRNKAAESRERHSYVPLLMQDSRRQGHGL